MSNSEIPVSSSLSSLLDRLQKAYTLLESQEHCLKTLVPWSEIEEHYLTLDASIKTKFDDLDLREIDFEAKKSEEGGLISEREKIVSTKEKECYDRIQILKDSAVTAILEAREGNKSSPLESFNFGDYKNNVSRSICDTNEGSDSEEKSPHMTRERVEVARFKPRPALSHACEHMDAKGLLRLALGGRKNLHAFRGELCVALGGARDPARLVMDSMAGFYPPEQNTTVMDINSPRVLLQACYLLTEALAAFLSKADPGGERYLNPDIKQQSKAIADDWKSRLPGRNSLDTNGNSLEVDAFLLLIATFNITSEFDEEEIFRLIPIIAHRRRTPELCLSLGLAHRMPDFIQDLIQKGKLMEVVYFSCTFELRDTYPPVKFLNMYLERFQKNENPEISGVLLEQQGREEVEEELEAVKAVVRSIRDFKLYSEIQLEPLLKRVSDLEKAKYNKKGGFYPRYHSRKKQRRHGRGGGGGGPYYGYGGGGQQTAPAMYSDIYLANAAVTGGYGFPTPPPTAAYPQQGVDPRMGGGNPGPYNSGYNYNDYYNYAAYMAGGGGGGGGAGQAHPG